MCSNISGGCEETAANKFIPITNIIKLTHIKYKWSSTTHTYALH